MGIIRRVLVVVVMGVSACAGGGGSVVSLAADLSVADGCQANPAACGICRADPDCADSVEGPRCGPSHVCVACLPSNDNCPPGQVCQQVNQTWTCVSTCAVNADCSKLGGGGSLCCAGLCVNPATDVNHCGSCGAACGVVANGTPGCTEGHCVIAVCNPGFDDCDKAPVNGCEAVISADPMNCGGCGSACKPFPNGLPTCTNSVCSAICAPGYADCNVMVADGCEVDTTFDIKHCGGCGKACAPPANAVAYCDLSKCSYRCKLGFGDCDGNPGNGCETNMDSNSDHCGHCGNICPVRPGAVSAVCTAGRCGSVCVQGFGDCDNNANNGCEAKFDMDVANCGGCGKACKNNNAIATCSQSICTLQCNPGFVDCNMDSRDGCEANLKSDPKNCGGCGMPCPQNLPGCSNGMCVPGFDFGPVHSFTGLMGTHWITQGGCSSAAGNIDLDAAYFCTRFYGQPLGLNCVPVKGYVVDRLVNCADVKLHKNGGCTANGNNVPNTTCDNGPCKIGNWVECTSGIANLVCHCQ